MVTPGRPTVPNRTDLDALHLHVPEGLRLVFNCFRARLVRSFIRRIHVADLRSMWGWFRGGKRRPRHTPRPRPRPPLSRLSLESLDDRCLPSVTLFPIPSVNTAPEGITRGPDGNLYFRRDRRHRPDHAGRPGHRVPPGAIARQRTGRDHGGAGRQRLVYRGGHRPDWQDNPGGRHH